MAEHLIYWLGTAPDWELMAVVVVAILGLFQWLHFVNSLTIKNKDKNEIFNYWSEFLIRRPKNKMLDNSIPSVVG